MSDAPRIVVLDGHTLNPGDNPWTELASLGHLTVFDRTPEDLVVERGSHAQILLTNKTRITAEHLQQLPALRFISVLATGVNVVDLEAATARGIPVSNVPEYGTDAVAQHTLALLLELCHRVSWHDAAVREGEWVRRGDFSFWLSPPRSLDGQTLGIIGLGRIGRRFAALGQALGMRILAARSPTGQNAHPLPDPFAFVPFERLLAESDVISLHCPLTEATHHLIDAEALAQMPPHTLLLNTSRGGLIDEAALITALREGHLGGVGLDVVSKEPMPLDHPLLEAPRCVITPHMAWASLVARQRLMGVAVANVIAFLAGSPIHRVA